MSHSMTMVRPSVEQMVTVLPLRALALPSCQLS